MVDLEKDKNMSHRPSNTDDQMDTPETTARGTDEQPSEDIRRRNRRVMGINGSYRLPIESSVAYIRWTGSRGSCWTGQHGELTLLVTRQGGVTPLRGVGVFCGRHAYAGRQLAHTTRGMMRR